MCKFSAELRESITESAIEVTGASTDIHVERERSKQSKPQDRLHFIDYKNIFSKNFAPFFVVFIWWCP